MVVLTVGVADLATNRVIKPLVGRVRPCTALPTVVLRIPCPEGPSFPSSHAVNMAALATVLTLSYRRWWWVWWSAALVVGLSRVYVGVHYPSDVLAVDCSSP
jgi:undecaprenyl-diphosphatase